MKKKRQNFFVENYLRCWEFARECRWFFVFALGVFALTFLVGFVFPIFFREEIFTMLRELMAALEGLSTFELIEFIFLNNLKTSFFAMMLGFGLGVAPLVICVVNGYLLGFVSREAVVVDGLLTMWRILPHGVFELPAVIFSIGIGMKFGMQVVKGRDGKMGDAFKEGLRFFVFVVFPLLVVAGIIEGILIGIGA